MFICFVCFHLNSRAEVSPRVLIRVSGSDGESAATGPESLLLKVAMQKKTEASRERMYVHHLWLPTSGPGAGKAHRVRQQSALCLLNELFLYSSSFRPYQVTTTLIWRMFHQSWLIVSCESEGTPGSWLNTNVLIDFTNKIKIPNIYWWKTVPKCYTWVIYFFYSCIDLLLIQNLCVSHGTTQAADMQNAPRSDSRDGGTPALTWRNSNTCTYGPSLGIKPATAFRTVPVLRASVRSLCWTAGWIHHSES